MKSKARREMKPKYDDKKNPYPRDNKGYTYEELQYYGFAPRYCGFRQGYEQALKDIEEYIRPTCRKCGKKVERERECYAVPLCYECLPPPDPIDIIELPSKKQ
jgi:hypothetical protein